METKLPKDWILLIYKIPSRPSRLRLQIWRKLQRLGALYLQDAVCLLPARPELDENMHYIAMAIEEMGGTYHLFRSQTTLPQGEPRLIEAFRKLADVRLASLQARLEELKGNLSPETMEKAETELKNVRIAYLRSRRLSYFGSSLEPVLEEQLKEIRHALDEQYPDSVHWDI